MSDLVITACDLEALSAALLGYDVERCAVLFVTQVAGAGGVRLLVREMQFPDESDYASCGPLDAELRPDFVARVTKRGKRDGLGIVFVHSHLGDAPPRFSERDRVGEERLARFLGCRHQSVTHAALVVSSGGMHAHVLGSAEELRVISLGATRDIVSAPYDERSESSDIFDRQVRLIGAQGQAALESLAVAVVGLGGTGSLVAQHLSHFGVKAFTLIDADVVEATNLNRVANSAPADVGLPKVDVAARYIQRLRPDASIQSVRDDIMRTDVARKLLTADLIFGCTDSHGSRAVLQQVAYQYLIPCIDMGVVIARTEVDPRIFGRVQLLAPGLACLVCSNLLDPLQVRWDMMTAYERQADPYFPGSGDPAPAVMSLNGTVVSLAMTMFLSVVAGFPSPARHLLYDAVTSTLRAVRWEPEQACYICSRSGSLARGESWPLFARSA